MTRLTPHFTLDELTTPPTAANQSIDNSPTAEATAALAKLCENVLEPLYHLVDSPITVQSGYRSPELNEAVGDRPHSQHVRGEAADISCADLSTEELFDLVRQSDLPFDQVINEFGECVHVSFSSRGANRRQALRAERRDGLIGYTRV